MSRVRRDGELFRTTIVTGPRHHFLALKLGTTADPQFPIKVHDAVSGCCGPLDPEVVRDWILDGVRQANEGADDQRFPAYAEIVRDDSPTPGAFALMAYRIVQAAREAVD